MLRIVSAEANSESYSRPSINDIQGLYLLLIICTFLILRTMSKPPKISENRMILAFLSSTFKFRAIFYDRDASIDSS
jgi:hypothetical protein